MSVRHLIDVKALKQDLMRYGLIVWMDLDLVTKAVKIVNSQLEVDAVPIEWIVGYMQTANDNVDSVISEMMRKYYDERNS